MRPQPFLPVMTIHCFRVLLGWDDEARHFVALLPDLSYRAVHAPSRTGVLDGARDLLAQRLRVASRLGIPLERRRERVPPRMSCISEMVWVEIAQP